MAATIPTYIPCPNWDIPATSTLVTLGGLISDPKNPESRIPKSVPPPIPPGSLQTGSKTDWHTTSTQLLSGKLGVWAQCLQIVGLGGDLSFGALKSSLEDHRFDALETQYFLPDDEYVQANMNNDFVRGYLEVHEWRKPVYMITGIKVARGASVANTTAREVGANAKVGADATMVGAPVTLGPEVDFKKTRERSVAYAGSTDYVFAYRLKRIRARKGGKVEEGDYIKGALFGMVDDDGEGEEKEQTLHEAYEIDDFDDTGEGIPDVLKQVF
ncbi:hypothetical protein MMC29_003500 [Sticta canariensis]|nr:hypothetical protein [Sticta canariensis]